VKTWGGKDDFESLELGVEKAISNDYSI